MAAELDSVETLYNAYGGPLFVFALRTLGDRGLAEEVVQDTIVRAWRHADRFDPARGSLSSWLFTIARNLATDRHRQADARPRMVAPLDRVDPSVEADLDRTLEAWLVADALSHLSDAHRDAIIATFYRGRSVAEAAQELGIPTGTVKSRVYYGLRALRVQLEELGVVS